MSHEKRRTLVFASLLGILMFPTQPTIAREGLTSLLKNEAKPASAVVEADDTSKMEDENNASHPLMLADPGRVSWLRTSLSFLFVTSLIGLCAAYLKRRSRSVGRVLSGETTLQVLHTLPLGLKRQLVAVDFQGMELLLAVTDQQIQLLYVPPTATTEVSEIENQQEAAARPEKLSDKMRFH